MIEEEEDEETDEEDEEGDGEEVRKDEGRGLICWFIALLNPSPFPLAARRTRTLTWSRSTLPSSLAGRA
jgi:hypothetical protein